MKIIMEQAKPGQSKEDLIREMKEKHGLGGEATFIDGANMEPDQLKAMLAGTGMSDGDIEAVLSGKEPGKKKGFFSRITDALLE